MADREINAVDSEKETLELWQKYKEEGSAETRDRLIEKYAPFVKYIAGRVVMNLPPNVEFDDLVGYGVFGLIDAIEKYDPSRNIKFKTYAHQRIRGAMIDELRAIDWTPRSVRQKVKLLEQSFTRLGVELGRPAKDEEVAKDMNITLKELYSLYNDTQSSLLLSLDEVYYDDENNSARIDFLQDDGVDDPVKRAETEEIKRLLTQAIDTLSERERLVVSLYYFEELTLKEIGKVLGVSDSRVSQLHTKAILRLRGKLSDFRQDLVAAE